jgi:hypothetical protein
VLLDDVGPLVVGLRTLEWRWDRLADVGVDPGELLAELADRASGVAKAAADLGVGLVGDGAAALADLVTGVADRTALGAPLPPADLAGAVTLAADLHHSLELLAERR